MKKNNTVWKPILPPFRRFKKEVYLKHAETAQFIYQLGEGDTIRQISKEIPVKEITSKITKQKIAYLKRCFIKYRKITGYGRGIAAIQVGILERFAVIYTPDRKNKLMVVVNPKIVKKSKKLYRRFEACMSEGPVSAPVVRPAWIEFGYYDEEGKKQVWNTHDIDDNSRIYNRVFQHEIDHMDGKIFLDKAELDKITLESNPTFYDSVEFEEVV